MQYELEILEKLVENKLHPVNETSLIPELLKEVLSCAQKEKTRIKSLVVDVVNKQIDDCLNERFIRRYQVGLINILDSLNETIEATENGLNYNTLLNCKELKGVQKTIYIIIEELLSFIVYRYYRFCDLNIKITDKYRYLCVQEYKRGILEIESRTLKLNQGLITIGLKPLKRKIENKKLHLTYGKVLFYNELLRLIKRAIIIKDAEERENELIKAFLNVNFNSVYFVQYCIKRIKSEVEVRTLISDKLEWLAWCLKVVKQAPSRKEMFLMRNNPSVKELLSQWIIEEIGYWEIKLKLQIPNTKDVSCLTESNIKIATDLSVPQLACFVRLLVETKTFVNKRKEDILEFYPEHYQSKRMESFEYGSFRSKYYGIQESTKESVKDLLIKMLNELRKL